MAKKRVYFFGGGKADGDASMKQLLGGKGANLAEMTSLAVPVPPGFTIATSVCKEYEEKTAATEQEWEAAFKRYKLDLQNVSYHLSYEVVESEWLAGNIEGEEAIAKMEKQLVRLGNDYLLSLWDDFLTAETEQESTDKALEFNTAYYREMIELMDSLVEKYGLLGY